MPQLISHRDAFSWQTPNVSVVLAAPRSLADQTGQLRGIATMLVRRLAEQGTPVRLQGMTASASHSRYQLLPEKVGVRGQERLVTLEELQTSIQAILPHLDATHAQIRALKADSPVYTLFLRGTFHKPLNLMSLLTQKAFTDAVGYHHVPLGLDLEQQVVVEDLTQKPHWLVIGAGERRLDLLMSMTLTLLLMNSPSYLRVALVGADAPPFNALTGGAHILGNTVTTLEGFRRLAEGLLRHLASRKKQMEAVEVNTLEAYNQKAVSNRELSPLPRLVVLIDSVAIPDWSGKPDVWAAPLMTLLGRGGELGLNILMTARGVAGLPERLRNAFSGRVDLLESASVSDLPLSVPTQFMDAIIPATQRAFELAAVANDELTRVVTYWNNMKNRRNAERESQGQPLATGNTSLLSLREDMTPPAAPANIPASPLAVTLEMPATLTEDSSGRLPIIPDRVVASARALAAYLGWLSVGALRDILGQSDSEARETLQILRTLGILEESDGRIWRFVRLGEPPEDGL